MICGNFQTPTSDSYFKKNEMTECPRKPRQPTSIETLNLFPFVTCLSCSLMPHFELPTQFGHVNFCPLLLCGWCSTNVFTLSCPEKTELIPSPLPVMSVAEPSTSVCGCARDFETPVFLSHFRSCYSITTVCFIYLYIYLFIPFPMSCSITLHMFMRLSMTFTLF